ncbi:tRNA threonylcarbamoyladenosine biosynthesis protein TsaB [Phycisphaerae bacterium RAS1]|nr:tRNA threonylcarbamoyladenosine biosynthesis protein TsaB [Phycisphaerae bacterium RAS1]
MSAPWLLAIETSVADGAVALAAGAQVMGVERLAIDRRHAAELFPAIQRMLNAHRIRAGELAVTAFSAGPGSFTGLRMAAVTAQMLAATTGCAVVAVPTMEVIAAGVSDAASRRIAVMLTAKRGQIFGAAYGMTRSPSGDFDVTVEAPPGRFAPADWLAAPRSPCRIVADTATGNADAESRDAPKTGRGPVPQAEGVEWLIGPEYTAPRVEIVARLGWQRFVAGQTCPDGPIVPLYLRPPECEEVYEQRRAAARERRGE